MFDFSNLSPMQIGRINSAHVAMLAALESIAAQVTSDRRNRNGLIFDTVISGTSLEKVIAAIAQAKGESV